MMGFLIELQGNAIGCIVTPTVSRKFSSRKGEIVSIDMDAITNAGYDGFLCIAHCSHINIWLIASGMETYVQVELPYPWSNHRLTSNVPIESFCRNGYFDSVIYWIKFKINRVIAIIKFN